MPSTGSSSVASTSGGGGGGGGGGERKTNTTTATTTTTPEQKQQQAGARPSQSSGPGQHPPPQRWVRRYRTEVAAGMSSVLSTLATFPLDSVKTRMQTYGYTGFLHCARSTYQAEKLRGFFRGKPSSHVGRLCSPSC